MKTLFGLSLCLLTLWATAQQDSLVKKNAYPLASGEDKYCAMEMGPNVVIMWNTKTVTHNILLANGSTLTPEGIIINKDKSRIILKEGECVDTKGTIIERSEPPKLLHP